MDAHQFLAEFEHLAHAPGGVPKLRELVIQLAISGRLVEYVDSETSVTLAIDSASELRRDYANELGLRSTRMQPPLDSGPFAIPNHWQWTRLEQICLYIQRGKGPKYAEKGSTHVISQKCVQWSGFNLSPARFVSDESLSSYGNERFLCSGDLLWNSTGTGTAGRVAIYYPCEKTSAVADSHVTVIRLANSSPRYLWCVLASPWVQSRIEPSHPDSLVSGTTKQVELNTTTARALPVPLPPLEEQQRIVAKVDEMMALCDTLEEQQQDRRRLQTNLRQSTLQAVATAASPYELQTAWPRLAENFGELFNASEEVDDLRKAILDLSVSGYLSAEDERDEPAKYLKAKILAAKEKGVAGGSVSRKKHVKPEELKETILPPHWESITLDEAISKIDAGWSPACLPRARGDETKWGVLKTTAVQVLRFFPDEHKELPASLDPRPQYQIKVGDILITRAGPRNRVGICCVVDCAPPRLMISDKLIRFHIVEELINPRFVSLCLSAGESGRILERLKSGMADSQMNISQDKLRSITIPLPPIEEQERILAKIDGLMDVLDAYGKRLSKRERLAEQVAAAAVSALTGVDIVQEEEPMKAPKTELIAPLRLGTLPGIKAQAPLATILARNSGELTAKDLWQRFGGEIDDFYAQLKTEVAHGWILEPAPGEMCEKQNDTVGA